MKKTALVFCIGPALGLVLVAGCRDANTSKDQPKVTTVVSEERQPAGNDHVEISNSPNSALVTRSPGAVAMTPLDRALSQWRQGNRTGAIQSFLETDWEKKQAALANDSPLRVRETDLGAMSAAQRERVVGQAMLQLKDLRELASAVRDKGVAVAASDRELSQRCFAKLDQCGATLDQPEALKILQLTARSIRKLGATQSVQAK